MGAQGYKPKVTLAKDNESEIRMLLNGKASCTTNSKHVAIKYFWSTDRIKQGGMKVKHCPTEKMLADFMCKHYKGHSSTNSEMCSWGGHTWIRSTKILIWLRSVLKINQK